MRFQLQHVHFMPEELTPEVLYVSREFGAVAHLCACGCRAKVRTPLGPTEWMLEEEVGGPTLYPSVGNWQEDCQSHYWIIRGEVRWAEWWSPEMVVAGRRMEQEQRRRYFDDHKQRRGGRLRTLWRRLLSLLG